MDSSLNQIPANSHCGEHLQFRILTSKALRNAAYLIYIGQEAIIRNCLHET
jgi:hypothetical protein